MNTQFLSLSHRVSLTDEAARLLERGLTFLALKLVIKVKRIGVDIIAVLHPFKTVALGVTGLDA